MALKATQYRPVAAASIDQRSEERHRVTLTPAAVRRIGAQGVDGSLFDVSVYGCRVYCLTAIGPDERVFVRLAGGMPIAATTVWVRDGFVGCRFDAPISRDTVRNLTLRLV